MDSDFDHDGLYFIPLGGSEQFGVNLNVYAYDDTLIAVDLGLGFADERHPGIDLLLPDPAFLEDRREALRGLIITHAHEDHVGAVAHLWPRLRCPVYCSRFTAAVLHNKLLEAGISREVPVHIVEPGQSVKLGAFRATFIHVAHSIPNACAVLLESPAGTILHSGDWNLDEAPVIGAPTDREALEAAGKNGVLAYVGDSTNAGVPGRAGSEREVEAGLSRLFSGIEGGRIAVTVFASNIQRIRSICKAAESVGRSVALVGRSLHTMVGAARECGYLDDVPDFLIEEDLDTIPADHQVLIVTGSQGEYRAALARIARGEHRVRLSRGDTVIYSSRAIPGNEKEINAVKNTLSAGGVKVIAPGDTDHVIHVSGHPCRDEVADMFRWVRPRIVVPVHGEHAQLSAHAALAKECQVQEVVLPNNGSVVRLAPGPAEIVDHVPTALIAVCQNRLLPSDHKSIAARRKLQFTGAAHVTVALDAKGRLKGRPQVSTLGLIDPENPDEAHFEADLVREVEDILDDMTPDERTDPDFVHEEIRIGTRRFCQHVLGIKPNASVHVVGV